MQNEIDTMTETKTVFYFCPHCHSGNDPVLRDKIFACGTRINDTQDRTQACYRRQLQKIKAGTIKVENIF